MKIIQLPYLSLLLLISFLFAGTTYAQDIVTLVHVKNDNKPGHEMFDIIFEQGHNQPPTFTMTSRRDDISFSQVKIIKSVKDGPSRAITVGFGMITLDGGEKHTFTLAQNSLRAGHYSVQIINLRLAEPIIDEYEFNIGKRVIKGNK